MQKKTKGTGFNMNVGEATHSELVALVSKIQQQSHSELEKLLSEADRAGQGETLRQKWKQDVEDRLAFQKDQSRNGMRC